MKRVLYRMFAAMHGDKLVWKLRSKRLRILAYHGICEDRLGREPWVPPYFVTQSAFEQQLDYLRRHAVVLPLSKAIARLRNNELPRRSVCITFDDGYANNLYLAYPLLQNYGLPATIFVSTAYVESGEFFPFLRLRLIRLAGAALGSLPDYKTNLLDHVLESTRDPWDKVRPNLSADQCRALRPLCVDEISRFDPEIIEFGAHGHTSCILGNEQPQRREYEISTSIELIRRWTNRPVTLFSFPNGALGDFGEQDKDVLRSLSVQAAVTGIPGTNRVGSDPLELKRYPVGIHHDCAAFVAEVTGFRSALKFFIRR